MLGVHKDLFWIPTLEDLSVVHKHQRVSDFSGESHFVGDHHHRHPFICESSHHV